MDPLGAAEVGGTVGVVIMLLRLCERLIDKLIEKKSPGNGTKTVQLDLKQQELTSVMREVGETQQVIAQTLERSNDKLDRMDERSQNSALLLAGIETRTKETGSNVYKVIEELKVQAAREEGRREGGAE